MSSLQWLHELAPSAVAVVLLAVCLFVESLSGGFTEITSDLFCSFFLLVTNEVLLAVRRGRRRLEQRGDGAGSYHPTVVSVSFCTLAICTSLADVRWSTPALIPALLVTRLDPSTAPLDQSLKSTDRALLKALRSALVIAVLSLVLLRPGTQGLAAVVLAVIALAAQYAAFAHLHQLFSFHLEAASMDRSSSSVREVLWQTTGALTIVAFAATSFHKGLDMVDFESTIKLGLFKALKWALVFWLTTRKTPWDIAPVGTVFGYGVHQTMTLPLATALGPAIAAVAAIVQFFLLLSKTSGRRFIVSIMAVVPVCVMLVKFLHPPHEQLANPTMHPIANLARQASAEFSAMLERQSTTLPAATRQYQSRYGRDPPPGFDRWFEFAKSHDSPIIDDFDMIMTMIEPFWKIDPERLRNNLAGSLLSGSHLLSLKLRAGQFFDHPSDWLTADVSKLLGPVASDIPDFDAVFSSPDEPRVLISTAEFDSGSNESKPVEWYDGARHEGVFENMTAECNGRKTFQHRFKADVEDFGLPFVQRISNAKDICQHPEYESQHGFLQQPDTFEVTKSAVPIFTQSKVSTFDDLLIPAPIYRRFFADHKYDENLDVPWEEKRPTLYWAGSTTGSRQKDQSDWKKAHRQRFVSLAQHLQNSTQTFLTETEPGVWTPFNSTDVLSTLYDARFTAVIQCDDAACDAENAFFHPGSRVEPSESLRSRFVFDLDGNAYSGRFYVLLRSRSAVLKQTIFQEWHDERLFPWYHYIPISMSMGELPETMRFLALTRDGDAIASDIAEQGRDWRMKALRQEDEIVYMYRLLLEYSRVLHDDRDALKCEGCIGLGER